MNYGLIIVTENTHLDFTSKAYLAEEAKDYDPIKEEAGKYFSELIRSRVLNMTVTEIRRLNDRWGMSIFDFKKDKIKEDILIDFTSDRLAAGYYNDGVVEYRLFYPNLHIR
jgi:hypothetical protein